MMSELATLRGGMRSTRTRLLGPAAPGALHHGYDIWSPADYWLSDFRDAYLRGEVKGVIASVPAKNAVLFESFCIVPVPVAYRRPFAMRHREELLLQIQEQYKAAVCRAAAGGHSRRAKRLRFRLNATVDGAQPTIEAVDLAFADQPTALAYAAPLRELWKQIATMDETA